MAEKQLAGYKHCETHIFKREDGKTQPPSHQNAYRQRETDVDLHLKKKVSAPATPSKLPEAGAYNNSLIKKASGHQADYFRYKLELQLLPF